MHQIRRIVYRCQFVYHALDKRFTHAWVVARTRTGAGSVRGKRHGEVELIGGFSAADHVIAYKLLHKMSDNKQLTKEQVCLCALSRARARMHVDCCLSVFAVLAPISGVCLFLCFPASDCFLKLLHRWKQQCLANLQNWQ
jgi:hypothetical protein